MPRRGGAGRSSPSRGFSSNTRPARAPAPAPMRTAPPPTQVAHPPAGAVGQPRQPGMFAQMATTAAGVAVGSAVGHTIGHAMTGGGGGGNAEAAPVQQEAPLAQQQYYQQPQYSEGGQSQVCQLELRQFLNCAQNQSDISLCSGFNEALRECKVTNGLPL